MSKGREYLFYRRKKKNKKKNRLHRNLFEGKMNRLLKVENHLLKPHYGVRFFKVEIHLINQALCSQNNTQKYNS